MEWKETGNSVNVQLHMHIFEKMKMIPMIDEWTDGVSRRLACF